MPTNSLHFNGCAGKQIMVLVVLVAIAVDKNVVATPIVGGNVVERTGGEPKYPYMVSLQDRVEKDNVTIKCEHFCGGSLISSSWILTAAHCIHRKKPHKIVAVIGEENISQLKHLEYHEIDAFETFSFHPNTYRNDIALLSLRQPYKPPYTTIVNKWIYAKLPKIGMKANRKVPCKIIGYGATKHAGSTQSNLREGEVNVITNKKCEKILGHIWAPQTGENKFCALGVEQDTCQGDSGGPLMCAYNGQDYIYGIVSHGLTCGLTGVPSIYTVTIPYKDRIDFLINKN